MKPGLGSGLAHGRAATCSKIQTYRQSRQPRLSVRKGPAMQLNEIEGFAEDQDRGAWLELLDPVKGQPTGLRVKVAGPDSATQARARLALVDDLTAATDFEGRVSAENRELARLRNLARCVVAWEVQADGKPVPFSFENVLRLLRAGVWVQSQIAAFAADRRRFGGGAGGFWTGAFARGRARLFRGWPATTLRTWWGCGMS